MAETHLLSQARLELHGYEWFGHNRELIHKRAKRGSGGVGFFIKNDVCDNFDIQILDDNFEGILWLKMVHKIDKSVILPCVCYLLPENSSRSFDVLAFYDQLRTDIYRYQKDGLVYICGDFNSRCGDLEDFISGVDEVSARNVVDFTVNSYGDKFIELLIDSNFCILNGRNYVTNDFTSISTRGAAVVDYCVVSHVNLDSFQNFCVTTVNDMINAIGNLPVSTTAGRPDHSLLTWDIIVNSYVM